MALSRTQSTFAPPVQEARRWLDGIQFPVDRALINVSQAAPATAPPLAMREAMAEILVSEPASHLYGPTLGLEALRTEVAAQWSTSYGADIAKGEVAITSGCNQAFAAAITSLCSAEDEVILPTPWYFNHKMWLDMSGVQSVSLPTDSSLLPDPEKARALITPRTRAIVLVTPNNPAGVEYPSDLVGAFFELAQEHGIALIVDETYRDFDSRLGAPHDLFSRSNWQDTLIQLYSFSKAYRLTGHRVGAIVTSQARLAEVEKFLDTVTICPSQIGQRGALWGMQNLGQWLASERKEILIRRSAIETEFSQLAARGWKLLGLGAYFAYLKHPFPDKSDALAKRMVAEQSILCLPGTMFRPNGDPAAHGELRIAFANIDSDGIKTLFKRLEMMCG